MQCLLGICYICTITGGINIKFREKTKDSSESPKQTKPLVKTEDKMALKTVKWTSTIPSPSLKTRIVSLALESGLEGDLAALLVPGLARGYLASVPQSYRDSCTRRSVCRSVSC